MLLYVVVAGAYVLSMFALGIDGTSYGHLILFPLNGVIFTIMAYVSTLDVIRKNTTEEQGDDVTRLNTVLSATESATFSISMDMILSHGKSINLFMNHLSKEYVSILQFRSNDLL